jgi:hypothetical protein
VSGVSSVGGVSPVGGVQPVGGVSPVDGVLSGGPSSSLPHTIHPTGRCLQGWRGMGHWGCGVEGQGGYGDISDMACIEGSGGTYWGRHPPPWVSWHPSHPPSPSSWPHILF